MPRPFFVITLLALTILGPLTPSATADTAFSESHGQLFAIDPDSGETQALGPTGLTSPFEALAFGPDGELLGITLASTDPTLYAFDPLTGGATPIGSMGLLPPPQTVQGLAADALGRWWVSAGDLLYRLDPMTAQIALAATLDHPVDAMAAWGDQLYAVSNTATDLRIERVDTATGELEIVVQDLPIFEFITGASFDSRGNLRFLTIGGGILTVIPHGFYVADLDAGTVQQTYFETPFFGEPHAQIWGLALRGGLDPITVPTLGPWGGGLLVLLLVSAALFTLVRRES